MVKPLDEMTNEELWQLFPIILKDYQNEWKRWYADEKMRLMLLIGEKILRESATLEARLWKD